jgi:membrane protease subunit HflC
MSLYFILAVLVGLFFILRFKSVFTFVALLLLVLLIRSGVFVVNEGSQVVITQFGKIIGTPYTKGGFYFKIPFLWKATYFDKRIFIDEDLSENVVTLDTYFINIKTVVNWRIANAALFYQNMDDLKSAEGLLKNLVSGSIRQQISSNRLIDVVRSGAPFEKTLHGNNGISNVGVHDSQSKINRDIILMQMQKDIYNYAMQYGIEVVGIYIKNISYSASVERNIYNRMAIEQLTKAEEIRSLGKSEYEETLGNIELQYQKIISPAEKTASIIRGKAEAEATALYAQAYSGNEQFMSFGVLC